MLEEIDKLKDRHNESQVRHVSMSQSSSSSSSSDNVLIPGDSTQYSETTQDEFTDEPVPERLSTVLDLAQDEDQTDRYYDTEFATNRLALEIEVAGEDIMYSGGIFNIQD